MFPKHALANPNHRPASLPQLPCNPTVPAAVGLDLLFPEFFIASGCAVTHRASVPKATIDKNRDLLAPENEIGTPRQGLMAPPTGDPVLLEKRDHATLRRQITLAPDKGHDLRPLSATPDVGHGCLG
jgi:hypothetical protein